MEDLGDILVFQCCLQLWHCTDITFYHTCAWG